MSADVAEAKRKLPLPMLMHELGLGEHAKKSAPCPFHDDKHNSFSVYKNVKGEFRFKCFASCGEGDEITFLEKYHGISNKEATKLFLEMAGVNGAMPSPSKQGSTPAFDWQSCVNAFTDADMLSLQIQRRYSREICSWLKENGFIGKYENCFAFPLHNPAGDVVACHYPLKDGIWLYYPKGAKVRPLVIGELVPGALVHAFESYWDAFAFMDKSGERGGIIITRGASNGALVADVIPQSAKVYLWTQNDRAGQEWERTICANFKGTGRRVKIPAPHKDLNDWTRASATSGDLLNAMLKAETVREAEKSWDDALAESEVTATELHNLELTPRKKLLGDWFAEGDCGFIFAFRGVGKTWLALAIAQALATGGKLGDWQAPGSVKVLYLDSEMPADLMRERCDGLGGANDE